MRSLLMAWPLIDRGDSFVAPPNPPSRFALHVWDGTIAYAPTGQVCCDTRQHPQVRIGLQVPSAHTLVTALVSGVLLGGLLAITALGLSLVLGVMRLINLVHGELVIAGAYLGYVLLSKLGLDPLAGLLLIAPALALLAYPLQRVLLLPLVGKGVQAPLLTTFGLSVIAQNLFVLVFSADTRSLGRSYATASLHLAGLEVPAIYAISFAVAVVVLGGLGSVLGTLIGGIGLGVIESLGGAIFGDGYRDFIGLVVFLAFLALPERRAVRVTWAGALLAGALLLALAPSFTSDYTQQVCFRVLEYAALGQAWNLLAGYGGLVSLGSAAFIGIGAYTTAELTNHGLPLVPGMLVSGAFAATFATVVSPALFRLRGLYFTIGTLALAEALRLFMVNYNGLGGNIGIFLQSAAPTTAGLYWLALGVAAAATGLVALILRTRLAISLRAVRDDEDVARQMGLVSFRTKLFAFTLAAFLMGVVGGLQAGKLSQIEPYGSFGLQWTIDIVTVALIGGLGTLGGPLIGAVFTVALAEWLNAYPSLHLAITGAIVIVVVRFAPGGLWGLLAHGWARLRPERVGKHGGTPR